jgi:uncharacterized metal-binding protein
MSAGHVHFKASIILATGFTVGAFAYQRPEMFECAVGAVVGILISPDLDLSNGGIVGGDMIRRGTQRIAENVLLRLQKKKTKSFRDSIKAFSKRVGEIVLWIWKRFWRGYSSSFKHGSWGSHAVLFSTIIRLLYAYYWLIFIPHAVVKLLGLFHWELIGVLEWWVRIFFSPMFLYGLVSSDTIHFFLDKLTKESTK